MDEYDLIEARYSFRLPPLYHELHEAGCFDRTQPEKYLWFTDHQWLSLHAIAAHEFCDWQTNTRKFLLPFSHSARRDEWGWRLDWNEEIEPAVVFCERGPEGHGVAPSFQGFLYRMLLEEFSGTWLVESEDDAEGKTRIRRTADAICPHLPKDWALRIEDLSRRPWYSDKHKTVCVFPREECDEIIKRDLAFSHLNEEFQQEIEGAE